MPATSSVPLTGNPDIDGVLGGVRWTSPDITYSFPTLASHYGYAVPGFEAMNASQQAAVRAIFQMFESYTGLRFTEVTESATVEGTLRFGEENDAGTAYAYYPNNYWEHGGDVWLNHTDYNSPLKGTYSYATFVHEIGHALGLDHGHDGAAGLPYEHDSLEYSVMTYRSYVGAPLTGYTAAQGSYPQTIMLADIAALQHMYGANYATNAGDTVYRWSQTTGQKTVNGVAQTASTANKIFETLWDGGGVDTYDFSNYSSNLSVDLAPGGWTTTSAGQLASLGFQGQVARGNIANAYLHNGNTASLIENAIGGTGNDTLKGNQAANRLDGGAGDDRLDGGLGNDTIIGGLGVDTCVIGANYADCTITYDNLTAVFSISSLLAGLDLVSGVEWFAFADRTLAAGSIVTTPVIDGTAPTLASSSPADNSGSVAKGANIVLTFSENVVAGAGDIVIRRASDGVAVQTIRANDLSQVSVAGKVVTINPALDLAAGVAFYVTVAANAFADGAGNAFAGISAPTALNFTVAAAATINGTSSSNTLNGTDDGETINGQGGNDRLNGFGGADRLDGGSGSDTMYGGLGDDTYIVGSSTDRVVELAGEGTDSVSASVSWTLGAHTENLALTGSSSLSGSGNDLANTIAGNGAGNTLNGNGGDDLLQGLGGSDTMNGGGGNDRLFGGTGSDRLTGGSGADDFIFDAALGSSNIDRITDFSVVEDRIGLSRSIFAALGDAVEAGEFGLGSTAANSDIHIVYNRATGALLYDADGAGGAAAQQFATLSTNLSLTADDFFLV